MSRLSSPLVVPVLVAVATLGGCAAPVTHNIAEGAIGPYSGSVVAENLVFVSGKIGLPGDGFDDEVQNAIDRVEEELARSGLTLADLVHVTVYLVDMSRYAQFNQIYARRIPAPHPARVCVAVAALPAGAQVEITGIAHRGG